MDNDYISFTNTNKYKFKPFSQFPKVPNPEIVDIGIFNGNYIEFIFKLLNRETK